MVRKLRKHEEQAVQCIMGGKLRIALALLRLQLEIDDDALDIKLRATMAEGEAEPRCARCGDPGHHEDNHHEPPARAAAVAPVRQLPVSHAPTTCTHTVRDGLAGPPAECGELIRWDVDAAVWRHVNDQRLGPSEHPATPGPIAAPTLAPWR